MLINKINTSSSNANYSGNVKKKKKISYYSRKHGMVRNAAIGEICGDLFRFLKH